MAALTKVQTSDLARTSCGPCEVQPVDLPHMLREAIAETKTQLKVVASCFGVDQSYLTKMLAGEKPIPLAKLPLLPDEIERVLVAQYAAHLGLSVTEPNEEAEAISQLLTALGKTYRVVARGGRLDGIRGRALKAGGRE